MSHEYDSRSLGARQAEELIQHRRRIAAIQRPCGLISKDNGRFVHQRPGNGNTLTLATRDLRRTALPQFCETKPIQYLASRSQSWSFPLPGQAQRQCSILLHGQFWKKLPVLEDEAELLSAEGTEFLIVEIRERTTRKANLSTSNWKHAGETVKQRRLSGTALPGDRYDFSPTEGNLRVADSQCLTVEEIDPSG